MSWRDREGLLTRACGALVACFTEIITGWLANVKMPGRRQAPPLQMNDVYPSYVCIVGQAYYNRISTQGPGAVIFCVDARFIALRDTDNVHRLDESRIYAFFRLIHTNNEPHP